MLKRLVMWTGGLTCCVLTVTSLRADETKTATPQAKSPQTQVNGPEANEPAENGEVPMEGTDADSTKPSEAAPAVAETKRAPETRQIGDLPWHIDYAAAYRQATEEKKQLLLFFRNDRDLLTAGQFEQNALARPELREPLNKFVRVALLTSAVAPAAAGAPADAKPVRLLEHRCFAHMQGQAGLAIVDLMDKRDHLFGRCISAHPFTTNTLGHVSHVRTMLDLPRGTITQRTLTFVLRTHPERPASVWGQGNPFLMDQCRHASQLMCNYGSVGHHDWGNRSSYISGQFGSGPSEVASMGGGSNLFEVAHSCVNLWRGSGVHWGMMITPSRFFGYDMVQSPNGTWFANGIFVQ